ncbi:MAG TPA: lipopolysaccharide biosynthesis protein [Terracidiphilus sp.]
MVQEEAKKSAPLSIVVIKVLCRQWRLMGLFLGCGLILSIAIAFLIPSQYQSTVQIMPPGWQSTNANLTAPFAAVSLSSPGGGGLGAGLLNSRSPSGPLLGIIASRTMQDDLINRFNLQHVYRVRYLADARKILSRRTDASEDKPTGIVSITVADRDPVRARDLTAAYVDELNSLVVTMDTSAAHREREFLEQRLKEIQVDLESSEQELGHFSSRAETVDQGAQSKAMLDAIATVQGQLISAQSELHGLQAAYTDESVGVKQAKARVATLSGQLEKLEGAGGGDNSADGNDSYPSLRQLPLRGATYADFYRHTKTLEVAYELLSRELEAAKIQEAEEIPSVKVLDPPVTAQRKSFPPRMLLIAVGAFLSLLCGGIWIVSGEVWLRIDEADPWKIVVREMAASLPGIGHRS